MKHTEKICRADAGCHNRCKLKIYDFDGRKSIWGGECGRYDATRTDLFPKADLFERREAVWQRHMDGLYKEIGDTPLMVLDGRPTVGMQRALFGIHTSVFWAHFFDQLGYRLVLSPPTNNLISEKGVEKILVEACYPVKVSHGHVSMLMKKTAYLFLPTLIDMPTTKSKSSYYCPMVQCNSYMVRSAFRMESTSVLTPVVHMRHDSDTLAIEIYDQLGGRIKGNKSQFHKAIRYATKMQQRFQVELLAVGPGALQTLQDDELFVVVTGRPYNLYDKRMNLSLGKNLSKMGLTAIPMDCIDLDTEDLSEFPSMYWGLGDRILRTVKFVKKHSNAFGLHLTNFGCGADSFIEHFYRHLMGEKAYLILELDEHSAAAGVMTRLEAFKNVIKNSIRSDVLQREVSENAIHLHG